MARYNLNIEKAEDVFVIKQPHHKEKDRDIYWGQGGVYSETRSPLNKWNIIMDKLGKPLPLKEKEVVKIQK